MEIPNSYSKSKGFSLVEMLSVIAVIGIISAIAIPSISSINNSARDASARRNAQNITSIVASAQAAGLDFVVEGDLSATVAAVTTGDTVSGGVFDGTFFGLPLSEEARNEALPFLDLQGGNLAYVGNSSESDGSDDVGPAPVQPAITIIGASGAPDPITVTYLIEEPDNGSGGRLPEVGVANPGEVIDVISAVSSQSAAGEEWFEEPAQETINPSWEDAAGYAEAPLEPVTSIDLSVDPQPIVHYVEPVAETPQITPIAASGSPSYHEVVIDEPVAPSAEESIFDPGIMEIERAFAEDANFAAEVQSNGFETRAGDIDSLSSRL